MTNRLNILIVNIHSSANAGDDTLLKNSLSLLRQSDDEVVFSLSMNDPESFRGDEQVVGSFITWLKGNAISLSEQDKWPIMLWLLFPFKIILTLVTVLTWQWASIVVAPFLSKAEKNLLHAYFSSDVVASAAGNYLFSSGKLGIYFLLTMWAIFFADLCGKKIVMLPQTIGPVWKRRDIWILRRVLPKAAKVFLRDEWSLNHLPRSDCHWLPAGDQGRV